MYSPFASFVALALAISTGIVLQQGGASLELGKSAGGK